MKAFFKPLLIVLLEKTLLLVLLRKKLFEVLLKNLIFVSHQKTNQVDCTVDHEGELSGNSKYNTFHFNKQSPDEEEHEGNTVGKGAVVVNVMRVRPKISKTSINANDGQYCPWGF